MIKLDVEVPHVRGCRSPEVTSAVNQVIEGGEAALNEPSACARHCSALPKKHLKFLFCKVENDNSTCLAECL